MCNLPIIKKKGHEKLNYLLCYGKFDVTFVWELNYYIVFKFFIGAVKLLSSCIRLCMHYSYAYERVLSEELLLSSCEWQWVF